ncbi:MAG: TonB-dependent receptor plug domain-containing protein [Saprospiraceae bacterium]|nr:TonB-dependent receptor plug domain-containing protein [Saprospiraceae bacterium]
MLRALLGLIFLGTLSISQAQTTSIKIVDSESGQPLVGACVSIIDLGLGECTDEFGIIKLPDKVSLPTTVTASYIGYISQELLISTRGEIIIAMTQDHLSLQTIEVKGQGSSLKKDLALTVESLSLQEIQSTSESSFYNVLGNMREADIMTVSFGVKVVNMRGFNSSTPVRSLQLIDGVDNASPGLNYPLGNFVGLPELDVQGVDLVIGASSAFFGPGAFNGVINMRTKSPFRHQGLDVQLKLGERDFFETGLRWAKAFKNKAGQDKLGIKFNASYLQVYDWVADDASPSLGNIGDSIYQDNPGGYDAINRYGDEVSGNYTSLFEQFRHPGLGRFYRTGYWEKDLANYDSYNLKTSLGVHYLFSKDVELIATTNYGRGTTVMQLDNRLSLNNVWAMQNKLELKKDDRFFVRFYTTGEDAGDTYDIVSTADILQSRWRSNGDWLNGYKNYWFSNVNPRVKELPGFPEIGPAPDFFYDFKQAKSVLAENPDQLITWHQAARASQDGRYLHPGTPEFEQVFNDVIRTKVSEGGTMYVDRSRLYHAHGEYKFKPKFVDNITMGANYRLYTPYSEGTIFIDTSGTTFTTYEYGLYSGAEKTIANNRLKLTAALRLDKHENYDYLISPAMSAQYLISPSQSMRFSLSSALRNPTLIDQYYYFRVGSAILLGNITGYENLITLKSFEDYLDNGLDRSLLDYFDEPPIVPEKALATEIAYSGAFLNNKLDLDAAVYLNRYEDFIGYKIGLDVAFFMGFPGVPEIFRFAANAKDITYTTGFSAGFSYFANSILTFTGNYSWNKIFLRSDDPLIPAYNTPEHKFNLGCASLRF